MKNRKGVALVTAMIVLIVVLMIGSVMLYIGLTSYRTYVSSMKVDNTMSAAEAGVSAGIVEVSKSTFTGNTSFSSFTVRLGRYKSDVTVKYAFAQSMHGTGIEFSSGYEPVGSGISGGGAAAFFVITSKATGPGGERVGIQSLYRKVTLSSGAP